MPNKLTDSEIVKALECCIKSSHFGECFENECPLVSKEGCKVGKETLYPYVLDLINRKDQENDSLKAEVERLKETTKNMSAYVKGNNWGLVSFVEFCKSLKAEAYKEFAERLKKESYERIDLTAYVEESDIDNTLYELVGEDNG